MTTKKIDAPEIALGAPVSFRDFPEEIPESEPVLIGDPYNPQEPVNAPAKPATKKEN